MTWQEDFDGVIAALVVIVGGIVTLAIALISGSAKIRKAISDTRHDIAVQTKTNHGSKSLGDSQDRQTEVLAEIKADVKNLADGQANLREDVQMLRRDLSRVDERTMGYHATKSSPPTP